MRTWKLIHLIIWMILLSPIAVYCQQPTQQSPVAEQRTEPTQPRKEATDRDYIEVVEKFVDNLQVFGTALAAVGTVTILVIGYILISTVGKSKKEVQDELRDTLTRDQRSTLDRFIEMDKKIDERFSIFENTRREFQSQVRDSIQSGFKQFNDQIENIKQAVPDLVDRLTRQADGKLTTSITDLQEKLNKYESLIKIYSNIAVNVEADSFEELCRDTKMNYHYATEASNLSVNPSDPKYLEKRSIARRRIEGTIKAARIGNVDANMLFNTAMVASRLDMDELSLRLLTYAEYFSPSSSHKLALYRIQMTIGRIYEVHKAMEKGADGSSNYIYTLNSVDKSPVEIQNEAFENALLAAADAPLPQNEIVYSELHNMAEMMREKRGYERMLDVLKASYNARSGEEILAEHFSEDNDWNKLFASKNWQDQRKTTIPSTLPARIASTYALSGGPGWREDCKKYLDEGKKIAMHESPLTTWRKSFQNSSRLAEVALGTKPGSSDTNADDKDGSSSDGQRRQIGLKELLEMLQE